MSFQGRVGNVASGDEFRPSRFGSGVRGRGRTPCTPPPTRPPARQPSPQCGKQRLQRRWLNGIYPQLRDNASAQTEAVVTKCSAGAMSPAEGVWMRKADKQRRRADATALREDRHRAEPHSRGGSVTVNRRFGGAIRQAMRWKCGTVRAQAQLHRCSMLSRLPAGCKRQLLLDLSTSRVRACCTGLA